MQGTGGAVIATSLVLVVFLRAGHSRQCRPPVQPIANQELRHDSLLTLKRPHASPRAASVAPRPWLKEPELSRLPAAPPTLAGPAAGHWYGKGLERSFRRRRPAAGRDYSAAGAGGAGPWPSRQPLHPPRRRTARCAASCGSPVVPSLRSTERVVEEGRRWLAEEKLCGSQLYAGRSFGDSAPNRAIFFLRLQPLSSGANAKENSKTKQSPKRWGAHARTDPRRATVLPDVPPPCGDHSEGGWSSNARHQRGRLNLPATRGRCAEASPAATPPTPWRVQHTLQCRAPCCGLKPDRCGWPSSTSIRHRRRHPRGQLWQSAM